mmetsp:Transcript_40976/g.46561  ORF Transcript_40976/g.46561 Transcript_40976/m.46561 type:complete len:185 (-) Transcript_40976:411-965(-)|eukprot:CAMPEP_0194129740 /NCGR_PEP_ID=MMETSP0152-20130528/952_1 /TAXON_ID=1049557 /ORGANISM="Thalassiothrix antarctica, Strain L6-D1" /LENGTH=184 /DNA_ID=CAMNT_0038824069 /DNA_START=117 /DNA_END=671 /DNA_ORIENTATION=+
MKLFILLFSSVTTISAFSTPSLTSQSTGITALNLFGGKKKSDDAPKGGPMGGMGGMMDQLAMFKKAQEIAKKKQEIEAELKEILFVGKSKSEKVTAQIKYIPSTNPIDPQPEYSVQGFEFDDDWFNDAAPEIISTEILEAYRAGIDDATKGSQEKFQALAEDLQNMMKGGGLPGVPAPPAPPAE